MIAQMATLTLAGHETTSNTLSWALWEIAKLPEYQEKMRAEIASVRGKVTDRGDNDFTMEDLESMTYVNAALKVSDTLSFCLVPCVHTHMNCRKHSDTTPSSST